MNKLSPISTDYLIIGAGIIGLAVAYELKKNHPQARVIVIEKEADVAQHASGRNSGVLHAGFYYTKDSLKAQLTVEGNHLMHAFCAEHHLAINRCGKLVVTQNANELEGLHTLYERGLANGVVLKRITAAQVKMLEPAVSTYQEALWSKATSSVDPKEVCRCLKNKLIGLGVVFYFGEPVESLTLTHLETRSLQFQFDCLINCAGLYADRIAHQVGLGTGLIVLPFKGRYMKYQGASNLITRHIYPVPHLGNPFLGVHWTKTVAGDNKIGPTAIPAFSREQYQGLSGLKWDECLEITQALFKMWQSDTSDFRRVASQEMKKMWSKYLIQEACQMVHCKDQRFKMMPSGIRAQLWNKKEKQLVMDFIVEKKGNTVHILNAVSPAFTCAFSLAVQIVRSL